MQGRVKKFSPDRRFGSIRPDGDKIDLFFHRHDVVGGGVLCFVRGAHVSFVIEPDARHPGSQRAAQVTLIEETPAEKEKREKIQAIKEKGRQIRYPQIEAAKEKEKQIRRDRKIEIEAVHATSNDDRKPAYVADQELEDYFLSLPDEE